MARFVEPLTLTQNQLSSLHIPVPSLASIKERGTAIYVVSGLVEYSRACKKLSPDYLDLALHITAETANRSIYDGL
jgi:hypothetical protein